MKPGYKLTINIPEPCNEGWDNMTPADKGRFCNSCQKTVIDFTAMTDNELLDFFIKAQGRPICGHYLQTQINRDIVHTAPAHNVFHMRLMQKIAAAMLLFQSLATDAWAQAKKVAHPVAVSPTPQTATGTPVLKGQVLDGLTLKPIAGVIVRIDNTILSDTTNIKGQFSIALQQDMKDTFTLSCDYANPNHVPPQTTILSEEVSLADIKASRHVLLYRYPAEQMKEATVITYKPPEIQGGNLGGGYSITAEALPRKKNLWWKMTHIFRKKQRA